MLATGVWSTGLVALCALGARHSLDAATGNLILRFVAIAAAVVCAPLAIAALTPQRLVYRIPYLVIALAICVLIVAGSFGAIVPGGLAPPQVLAGAGAGFFIFLAALSPLTRSTLRLGGVGPAAAVTGAAGGIGYLALENLLASPFSAAAAAIALAAGVCVGAGVGADYAQHFARGLTPRTAAAAAGHSAVAPAAFSVLASVICMLIVTYNANFGAVDWRILAACSATVLLAAATAMVFASAALSMFSPSEQAAVDENRRRQRFAESWRPVRRRLPATTAGAASAIAGVLVVIALFEVGLPNVASLAVFLFLIMAASGLAFVSVRTSLLIAVLLFASSIFAGYVYAIFDMAAPAVTERFVALTLCAIAFSQLTVSWRNAGDIWRNARDIAQNAMSDGLRRFAIAFGAGGAATVASAYAFNWEAGIGVATYYAIVAGIGLFLAPVLMVALSAQYQQY